MGEHLYSYNPNPPNRAREERCTAQSKRRQARCCGFRMVGQEVCAWYGGRRIILGG